jgi:hypothetical protein
VSPRLGALGWVLAVLATVAATLLAVENRSLRTQVQAALEEQTALRSRVDQIAADKAALAEETQALAERVSAMADRVAALNELIASGAAGEDSP